MIAYNEIKEMMKRNSFYVALIAGLLSGCARFDPQPLSPVQSAARLETRSLNDPGLKQYVETTFHPANSWPPVAWDFTNLTLVAYYYSPDLDVARAKWRGSQAGQKTAAQRPNPTLSFLPTYDTTTTFPSPWVLTSLLDVPIETAGKRKYRKAEAAELSESARLNLASVAWQVRSRLRHSLVALEAAQKAETTLAQQQTIQTENVRLLELQFQSGAISAFELTQARLGSDNTRLAWRDAQRASAEARVQLAEALGVPVGALEGARFSFADLEVLPADAPPAEIRRQALLNRPDILGALADYAASQSALQLEIAKQYPDVHLNPGYEFDQGDNKWSVGFTVELPVLNQNQGPIAEARAKRAEFAANFNAVQARALAEIERALAGYRAALQKNADAAALQTRLQEQEQSAKNMFDAGEISAADLAALRLQLSASVLAWQEAFASAQQALGALEDALQSPVALSPSLWQNAPRISTSEPHS